MPYNIKAKYNIHAVKWARGGRVKRIGNMAHNTTWEFPVYSLSMKSVIRWVNISFLAIYRTLSENSDLERRRQHFTNDIFHPFTELDECYTRKKVNLWKEKALLIKDLQPHALFAQCLK